MSWPTPNSCDHHEVGISKKVIPSVCPLSTSVSGLVRFPPDDMLYHPVFLKSLISSALLPRFKFLVLERRNVISIVRGPTVVGNSTLTAPVLPLRVVCLAGVQGPM